MCGPEVQAFAITLCGDDLVLPSGQIVSASLVLEVAKIIWLQDTILVPHPRHLLEAVAQGMVGAHNKPA